MQFHVSKNRSNRAILLLALIPLIACLNAAAQADPCSSTASDSQIKCSTQNFQRSEHRLNEVYSKTLVLITKRFGQSARLKFINAQKQWLAVRETNCLLYQVAYQGGSFASQGYYDCKASFAEHRTLELQSFIDSFSR